jgi:2-polyprenyl-6-hydroxyphenyl methylase/3-demethylubiquinone-9 3-methyltransferase
VREAALEWGVLPYRTEPWKAEEWEQRYGSGHLDYFAGLDELPRYSLLLGYLAHLGGEPEVLDVGCGQGLFRVRMGALPFRRYVGIDPTLEAIAQAEALGLDDPRTTFLVGDITGSTPDLGRFDVVVCNEVLSMVEDPMPVLERVAALLRPGGHLLTSTWRHPGDRELAALLDERFALVDVVFVRNPGNPIARRGWRVSCHQARHEVSGRRGG